MINHKAKTYIKPNVKYAAEMPYSEVCMHMRVAGRVLYFELPNTDSRTVQLFQEASGVYFPFSAPILLGEAGIYTDESGHYFYRPM
jgi:hypothetical protein